MPANDVSSSSVSLATDRCGDDGDGTGSWRGRGLVLVIDDEEAARDLVGKALEYVGFEVSYARDGADALAVARKRRGSLVAVLLDVADVAGVGGSADAFAKQLAHLAPALPLIMTSGWSRNDLDASLLAKASGFLSKPFTLSALVRVMQQAIEPSSARHAITT